MHEVLVRALREHKKRVLIRSWEVRQVRHAKGVWFRLRRALALSEAVYAIHDRLADALEHSGHVPLAVGYELSPPKRLFVLEPAALTSELTSHPLRVRLDAALLSEPNLVLVPWSFVKSLADR